MPTRNALTVPDPSADPQLAWQHATSIGPDQFAETLRRYGGYKQAAMPDKNAGGLSLSELLGEIFTTPKGSNLPTRLRLTSYSPDKDQVLFHAADTGEPYAVTMKDFNFLHRNGQLQPEGGYTDGMSINNLKKTLNDILSAPRHGKVGGY